MIKNKKTTQINEYFETFIFWSCSGWIRSDPVRLPRQQAVLLLEEHVRETPVHRQVLDLDQDQRWSRHQNLNYCAEDLVYEGFGQDLFCHIWNIRSDGCVSKQSLLYFWLVVQQIPKFVFLVNKLKCMHIRVKWKRTKLWIAITCRKNRGNLVVEIAILIFFTPL